MQREESFDIPCDSRNGFWVGQELLQSHAWMMEVEEMEMEIAVLKEENGQLS